MIKQTRQTYKGIQQDTTKSKLSNEYYFEGRNIRIVATDTEGTGSVMNEKGNSFLLTIPKPTINILNKQITYDDNILTYVNNEISQTYSGNTSSGDQIIIGHKEQKENILIYSTDDLGFDCVWKLPYDSNNIELLYLRNLSFSKQHPIFVVDNYENNTFNKAYWIDGVNQMRSINVYHNTDFGDSEDIIDIPVSSINMVPSFNVHEPIIKNIIPGGTHTSGVIQYAYNLFRQGGSQSKLSPISKLVSLDKVPLGGGELNELVSKVPIIEFLDLDPDYTHIRVYAIKYTSLDTTPSISIIKETLIPQDLKLNVYDDGTILKTISLEDFLFLGSNTIIPRAMNSKKNRLFFANFSEKEFNIDLDFRAFSYNSSGVAVVHHNINYDELTDSIGSDPLRLQTITSPTNYDDSNLIEHDAINLDYTNYRYQADGVTQGGEGRYLKYELTQTTEKTIYDRFFKDDEIYRLGVQFYDKFTNKTKPRWIADFKSRNGNLTGLFNTLKIELQPEFFVWLNSLGASSDLRPIGYKILIADRTYSDRTIVSQGILSPMMIAYNTQNAEGPNFNDIKDNYSKVPNHLIRNCGTGNYATDSNCIPFHQSQNGSSLKGYNGTITDESPRNEFAGPFYADKDTQCFPFQYNAMYQLYSPELIFNKPHVLTNNLKFKVKGVYPNSYNARFGHIFKDDEERGGGGVDNGFTNTGNATAFGGGDGDISVSTGLIGSPTGTDNDEASNENSYWRVYGNSLNVGSLTSFKRFVPFQLLNITETISGVGVDVELDTLQYNTFRFSSAFNIKTVSSGGTELGFDQEVSFTITPSVGYTTVPYNISLTNDPTGLTALTTITNVTGTQTITYNSQNKSQIKLLVEPVIATNLFQANVNGVVRVKGIDPLLVTQVKELTIASTAYVYVVPTATTAPFGFGFINPVTTQTEIDIYGIPEITEPNQDFKSYNRDPKFRFSNSLSSVTADGDSSWKNDQPFNRKVVSVNGANNRCLTFVLGENNINTPTDDRPRLEELFQGTGVSGDNFGIIGELIKNRFEIYFSNIYGGNSFISKKRTRYMEIGVYSELDILNPFIDIQSPGDTFVDSFRFLRIYRPNVGHPGPGTPSVQEIVEYYTETSINLTLRNDLSFNNWDSKLNYVNNTYHKYNNVYSQTNNLLLTRDNEFTTRNISEFETTIISSKPKTNGELIDSWTDLLQNERITLDGKFGSINALTSFEDELYSFQDRAFARISIEPRVQTTGSDGFGLQLGTGKVLDNYIYNSTESGCVNKWSIVTTPSGIYYYDALNNSIIGFRGQISGISDIKGLHTYFQRNTDYKILSKDNPIIKQGVSSGYDYINNEILMSFNQGTVKEPFTLAFNESTNTFTSFYDYDASRYISKGLTLISPDSTNTKLYRHFDGEYNKFYDQYKPSYITLLVNPESNLDCVFNNIEYKSELYINDIDQPASTLSSVHLWNEYQDSGVVPLIVNSNISRKFRTWRASLPRQSSSRDRIRNPWVFLKLQFDNNTNKQLILHDILINYTI